MHEHNTEVLRQVNQSYIWIQLLKRLAEIYTIFLTSLFMVTQNNVILVI